MSDESIRELVGRILDIVSYRETIRITNKEIRWGHDTSFDEADDEAVEIVKEWLDKQPESEAER